ncbi:HvfA family oxazolone/thioamide-modified RiPP metallophore [Alishewanella tabrizica]|uniref:Low-complexity protein n=1 Tax=Alishewanella tabrizica TaxID=671278 RepID=A0ABQ2WG76_9ALTE|nr:hypothetical protein GCM10008111_07510 [Alishewanella tabrizica]
MLLKYATLQDTMMNAMTKTQLTLALGALTLSSGAFAADQTNPFQAQQLSMAYQITDNNSTNAGVKVKLKEQANSATNKATEMKCGEGKCGEGKCGAEMQKAAADAKKQAAAAKNTATDKAKEMKCGEGKCGEGKCGAEMQKAAAEAKKQATDAKKAASDKAKEMKCGEGKCGSH